MKNFEDFENYENGTILHTVTDIIEGYNEDSIKNPHETIIHTPEKIEINRLEKSQINNFDMPEMYYAESPKMYNSNRRKTSDIDESYQRSSIDTNSFYRGKTIDLDTINTTDISIIYPAKPIYYAPTNNDEMENYRMEKPFPHDENPTVNMPYETPNMSMSMPKIPDMSMAYESPNISMPYEIPNMSMPETPMSMPYEISFNDGKYGNVVPTIEFQNEKPKMSENYGKAEVHFEISKVCEENELLLLYLLKLAKLNLSSFVKKEMSALTQHIDNMYSQNKHLYRSFTGIDYIASKTAKLPQNFYTALVAIFEQVQKLIMAKLALLQKNNMPKIEKGIYHAISILNLLQSNLLKLMKM